MVDKAKWQKRIKYILTLDSHPGHIAAGFAVGVFISFTPFFGLHTAIAIVVALIFRLNKLTCITGSWVNTPFTVPPVLVVSYKLGRVLLGRSPQELHIKSELTWQYAFRLLDRHGTYLLLGTSVLGLVAAFLAYFLCYYLVVRFRRRDEALDEETREMEEVGEELDK
ncbi:MAG TPA: DUF2062 domain-containing protein [Geobacteraceae bacterium]|nr:DUF2062 domain-containing protein [Geobacteraceae bacterium]